MIEIDSKMKILVVSSDPDVALNFKLMLKKVGLNDVKTIESGIEALKLCESTRFGLIICDQNTRHMSGWLFIQELKNSVKIANIPVILMGAESSAVATEKLAQYGVGRYIALPVVSKVLMEAVSTTLSEAMSATSLESRFSIAKDAFLAQETDLAIRSYNKLYTETNKGIRSTIGLVNSYEQGAMVDQAEAYASELESHVDSLPVGMMVSLRYVYRKGDFSKARKITEDLIEKTKDTPIYFHSTLELAQKFKQFELGEVISNAALMLGYKGADFALAIARAQFTATKFEHAVKTLGRAIKEYGQSLEILNLQGISLRHLKKYDESKRSYELALALSPMDEKIYFNLALTEIHLNNIEAAKRHLNTCLSISPDFEKAKLKIAELTQSNVNKVG